MKTKLSILFASLVLLSVLCHSALAASEEATDRATVAKGKDPSLQKAKTAPVSESVEKGLSVTATLKEFDAAIALQHKALAGSVPVPTIKNLTPAVPPASYDLSKYVTFAGNQLPGGGCYNYTVIHTMQILNEMKCPMTPDPSFWYLHNRQVSFPVNGRQDPGSIVKEYGICPEGSLPSDYKTTKVVDERWDYSKMRKPTPANDREAAYYKAELSPPFNDFTTSVLKQNMLAHGPLMLDGPMRELREIPPDAKLDEWHCVTAVGWDDARQAFKILNSWGDRWQDSGFYWIPYDKMASECGYWQYMIDKSISRVGTKYAYSARIDISCLGGASRNNLIVKIGVVGKTPLVFWYRPNSVIGAEKFDDNSRLLIDVPLPDYAADCWPANEKNVWFVEVINESGSPVHFKGFTLAKQVSARNVVSYPWKGITTEILNGSRTFALPEHAISIVNPPKEDNGVVQGSNLTVKWNTVPIGFGRVSLYYREYDGVSWMLIAKDVFNSGEYVWKAPKLTTDFARFRIVFQSNNVTTEAVSAPFSIGTPKFLFRAPTELVAEDGYACIALKWKHNNKLSGVVYEIERKVAGTNDPFAAIASIPQADHYLDKQTGNPPMGSTYKYTYRIRAKSPDGQYSPYTNESTAAASYSAKVGLSDLQKPDLTLPVDRYKLPIEKPKPNWEVEKNTAQDLTVSK